jgi:ribosome-associated heat shock protein Hsp15
MTELPTVDRLRLDKWLWAARLFKTRALAAGEVDKGRVRVGGQPAKPGRELKAGDPVALRQDGVWREFVVLALSPVRGPAPLARTLYAETPESVTAHQQARARRTLAAEPALGIAHGRPTKRDRRQIAQATEWHRWSAQAPPGD